jgi:glutamate-ammonia-ligase adenylyltransferase
MKPTPSELQVLCPGVPEAAVVEHLTRLDESYFDVFAPAEIARHVVALAGLSPEQPVSILAEEQADGFVACTVAAFDYPGEFALITGVLSAAGFDIASGDVFTYALAPEPAAPAVVGRGRRRPSVSAAPLNRRKILDRFMGVRQGPLSLEAWREEVARHLSRVLGLLESGGAEAAAEAKRLVNEQVARRLGSLPINRLPVLYPVELEVDNAGMRTRLVVRSQDTPVFLYAMSGALSLQGLVIERVTIRTTAGRIEDTIEVADARGAKITDAAFLDRLKLTVLMTKQFTYFVGSAPDPYAALCRFEQLLEHALRGAERGQWLDLFSNPDRLRDLARLLGASDFLWEDFIRLQYETLLPLLRPASGPDAPARPRMGPALDLALTEALAAAGPSLEEQAAALNAFKDREIFRMDLDHILEPGSDVTALAVPLTRLAELVVNAAVAMLYRDLAARHGVPRTVAGLEVEWALFGLGKFGGVAMGYASDIELLFVFGDNGRTDGADSLDNLEFFDQLMRRVPEVVRAPREGIFHVDLRLRPYGSSGPAACSLAGFCRYYGPGGQAHSYERLSLVRLRAVGGSAALGARVERLRDEFVYAGDGIRLAELHDLRQKQLADKAAPGRHNAKFSPGSLVDLEYAVQVLQVLHGRTAPSLRTPRIHEALRALSGLGVIRGEESRRLTDAYYFLRRLVNGLRMLRGSARDLFLPPHGSLEFAHLARRMGYSRGADLEPEQQLHLDFEAQTAYVRAFIERQFGRDSIPGPESGNVADLVLSDSLPETIRRRILADAGFQNPARADVNLRGLAGRESERRERFAWLAVLACDFLRGSPDPDMALNNWERFVQALPDAAAHFERFLSQPKRLELLLGIFGASQFLADTLIRNPDFLDWATDARVLHAARGRDDLTRELAEWAGPAGAESERLRALGRFRRREILRIGTRDICLLAPMAEVTADLSALAEAAIQFCLDGALAGRSAAGFCILAFGKLGGRELNYSSDIDLVGLVDPAAAAPGTDPEDALAGWDRVMRQTCRALAAHTEEGHAYRVDLRLRPYGGAGALVSTLPALAGYYRDKAAAWEIQALLKARPVAGDLAAGERFLAEARGVFLVERPRRAVVESIEALRAAAMKIAQASPSSFMNVKTGRGGIRDVEFLVQGLQLMFAPSWPDLIQGNTLVALDRLRAAGLLADEAARQLREDYILLRRVEHFLQIFEDRQVHDLPGSLPEVTALGKRVFGPRTTADEFLARLDACLDRVHGQYRAALTL